MIEFGRCAYNEGGLIRSAGSLAEGGENVVHLDEDALAGADFRRFNHSSLLTFLHEGKTSRPSRVILRQSILHDVRNAIFQQGEYIWGTINAKTITST